MVVLLLVLALSVASGRKVYKGSLEPLCNLRNMTPTAVLQKCCFTGNVEMTWSLHRMTPDLEYVVIMVNAQYPSFYRRHIFQVRDQHGQPFGTFDRDLDVCLVDCPPGRKNTAYYVKNRQSDLMAVWFPPKKYKPNDTAVLHLSSYHDDNKYWTETYPIPKRNFWTIAIDAIPR